MSFQPSTTSRLQTEIHELGPWFHNLHLPDGTQTAPDHFLGDFPGNKWAVIRDAVPEDLTGKTALDIGCNAGFYSIELVKRGALVTAIDHDEHYLRQARWAADVYGFTEQVTFQHAQLYDFAHHHKTYDIVWFMGVLYHLRYPMLGLDIVSRLTNDLVVLQTMTSPGEAVYEPPQDFPLSDRDLMREEGWPTMAFIEHRLQRDPTNWWAPNHACVEAMVRSTGLDVVSRPAHEVYVCRQSNRVRPHQDLLDAEYMAATQRSQKRVRHV